MAGGQSGPGAAGTPEPKICASCGRKLEWRKKWERSWDEVRYCSKGCKSRKVKPVDEALEQAIISLLHKRAAGATICPSEAAQQVGADFAAASDGTSDGAGDDDLSQGAWRPLMEPARAAARRLVAAGDVEITQRGQRVDPSTAKGPIRIRLTTGANR